MRIRTLAALIAMTIATAGIASACGADKQTKADTKKQTTASTQPVKTDTAKKKG